MREIIFLASSVGLGTFCLASDYVIFKRNEMWQRMRCGALLKASLDNAVHARVGGWSWAHVVLLMEEPFTPVTVLQVACCTGMASVIDLDHFISARSLSLKFALACTPVYLYGAGTASHLEELSPSHSIRAVCSTAKDALNLQQRPFAHNTTLVITGTALLSLLLHLLPPLSSSPFTRHPPAMFLIACLSHHLRDADRRGVWFGPFGSTPPIPYRLYPLLVAMLPVLLPQTNVLVPVFKWVWSYCVGSPTQVYV